MSSLQVILTKDAVYAAADCAGCIKNDEDKIVYRVGEEQKLYRLSPNRLAFIWGYKEAAEKFLQWYAASKTEPTYVDVSEWLRGNSKPMPEFNGMISCAVFIADVSEPQPVCYGFINAETFEPEIYKCDTDDKAELLAMGWQQDVIHASLNKHFKAANDIAEAKGGGSINLQKVFVDVFTKNASTEIGAGALMFGGKYGQGFDGGKYFKIKESNIRWAPADIKSVPVLCIGNGCSNIVVDGGGVKMGPCVTMDWRQDGSADLLPDYALRTYIDMNNVVSKNIIGANVSGGNIYGQRYYNFTNAGDVMDDPEHTAPTGDFFLQMRPGSGSFLDLAYASAPDAPVLSIGPALEYTGVKFYSGDTTTGQQNWLSFNNVLATAYPQQTWSFYGCNAVLGLETGEEIPLPGGGHKHIVKVIS